MVRSGPTVVYTNHARGQMTKRRISERQVEQVIIAPTSTRPSTNPPGRIIAERVTAAGNTLRVVYRDADGGMTALVITVIRIGRERT